MKCQLKCRMAVGQINEKLAHIDEKSVKVSKQSENVG